MSIAIIGGTGAQDLFETLEFQQITSPFGKPSAKPARIVTGSEHGWFLPRHGRPHHIPPHRINYRANIHCLRTLGATRIIAINACGGVDPNLPPGSLVLPDQLIDYTWGRAHTFSDGGSAALKHVEFSQPFAGPTRELIIEAASAVDVELTSAGCYGATQGPRLETAAEIRRLAADGCSLVGMTAMPEAALAREAGLDYACLCIVTNPAAGLTPEPISEDAIHQVLGESLKLVGRLLRAVFERL